MRDLTLDLDARDRVLKAISERNQRASEPVNDTTFVEIRMPSGAPALGVADVNEFNAALGRLLDEKHQGKQVPILLTVGGRTSWLHGRTVSENLPSRGTFQIVRHSECPRCGSSQHKSCEVSLGKWTPQPLSAKPREAPIATESYVTIEIPCVPRHLPQRAALYWNAATFDRLFTALEKARVTDGLAVFVLLPEVNQTLRVDGASVSVAFKLGAPFKTSIGCGEVPAFPALTIPRLNLS